jgi:hypothetical protein
MTKQSLTIICSAFAMGFLSWSVDVTAEDLGFGYVRRGERIHFEGGGTTGRKSTRIDEPSRENIDGFKNQRQAPIGRKTGKLGSSFAENQRQAPFGRIYLNTKPVLLFDEVSFWLRSFRTCLKR